MNVFQCTVMEYPFPTERLYDQPSHRSETCREFNGQFSGDVKCNMLFYALPV